MMRPRYDTHVEPRLGTIKAWKRQGLTNRQIAKNLGIGFSTLNKWMNEHVELLETLRIGREDAIAEVENAHFKMATGYSYNETRIEKIVDKEGNSTGFKKVIVTRKRVVPSVTAQIHILKNQASKHWNNERQNHEVTGKDGAPLESNVHIYLPDNGREKEES